jgi:hypothetical protein
VLDRKEMQKGVFLFEEAWFTENRHVNSQSDRYLLFKNPHAIYEIPLHDLEDGEGVQ